MSPVCEPPRRSSTRSVVRIARCSALALVVGVDVDGGACRVDAGPPQRLVDEQVAEAGDAALVHEHRLDRRGRAAERVVELRERERQRVGTEPGLVGIELDRAEPARVAQHERRRRRRSARRSDATSRRAGCSRRRADRRPPRRRRARGRSCRGARRAHGPASSVSSRICLPRRRAAVNALPTSACRSAAAVVPRFRNHVSGACTVAISRSSARASSSSRAPPRPRGSPARRTQKLVIAPVSAPCASLAYLARKPLV